MTKISYIQGIGASEQERRQRAGEIPSSSYINYTAWTAGETRLALLADQAAMLAAYFPENREIQKAKNILVDVLRKGVHRASLPTGIFTGTLADVMKEVRQARQMTRPAAGKIYNRANIGAGISDPLIPVEDCATIEIEDPLTGWTWQEWEDPSCPRRVKLKKILNDHLEKSSHHLLYEFVANPNAVPNVVAVKSVNHRAGKEVINQITDLGNDNLRLWLQNGILRHNILEGAGPLQPTETIQLLRDGAQAQAQQQQGGQSQQQQQQVQGIHGAPIAAILLAVAKVVAAIATAVGAAAALVSALKAKESQAQQLFNQLQGIGTHVWGPGTGDWQGSDPTGNEELNTYLPWLLIGGGALLFLNDK